MNKYPFHFALLFSLCFSCGEIDKNANDTAKDSTLEISEEKKESKAEFAIIIHGGAGTILKKNMTSEKEAAYKAAQE